MLKKKTMVFMSYASLDDQNMKGWMRMFCECLSREVSLQMGEEFEIFQDRHSINAATFLVAMITPAFFRSDCCRDDLEKFLGRERSLDRNDLVLPVYCVDVSFLQDQAGSQQKQLAESVMARQLEDWRELRLEPLDSPQVRKALVKTARQIAQVAKQLKARPESDKPVDENPRSSKVPSIFWVCLLVMVVWYLALRPEDKEGKRTAELGKGLSNRSAILSDQPNQGDAMREETTGMELVWVPGGCFQMGSAPGSDGHYPNEAPVHEVCLDGFWLGRLETTQTQWKRVMGTNPSSFKGAELPVDTVSWHDVQEFLARLNAKTGGAYRLPTEAEWEHACRAGGSGKYCGGTKLDDVAWHYGNADGTMHSGGKKAANAFGLHDMSGNVFEWCSDWYDESYYQQQVRDNPQGPATGFACVVRGGSWSSDGRYCRSTSRSKFEPTGRGQGLGFRIARSQTSKPERAHRAGGPSPR